MGVSTVRRHDLAGKISGARRRGRGRPYLWARLGIVGRAESGVPRGERHACRKLLQLAASAPHVHRQRNLPRCLRPLRAALRCSPPMERCAIGAGAAGAGIGRAHRRISVQRCQLLLHGGRASSRAARGLTRKVARLLLRPSNGAPDVWLDRGARRRREKEAISTGTPPSHVGSCPEASPQPARRRAGALLIGPRRVLDGCQKRPPRALVSPRVLWGPSTPAPA